MTRTLTSVEGFLGWASFVVDPPLWSLNAPYARHRMLTMWTIPHKVISHFTHKAMAMVHSLSHSKAQPLNDLWLMHLRVQQLRVLQEQLLLSQHCNPSCGGRVSLYLSLHASEDSNLPLWGHEGCHTSIFLASVYRVSKLAPA